jgi:hypothetical protein
MLYLQWASALRRRLGKRSSNRTSTRTCESQNIYRHWRGGFHIVYSPAWIVLYSCNYCGHPDCTPHSTESDRHRSSIADSLPRHRSPQAPCAPILCRVILLQQLSAVLRSHTEPAFDATLLDAHSDYTCSGCHVIHHTPAVLHSVATLQAGTTVEPITYCAP